MVTMNLIVVDDKKHIASEITKGLQQLGVTADVHIIVPEERSWPYNCTFPIGRAWDRFDVAIVDLELFDPQTPHTYRENDLQGGSEVLPFIRREAPWLPVIAMSYLFEPPPQIQALPMCAGFGFDGHIPRSIFRSPGVVRQDWLDIIYKAKL